jgi:integrase
MNRYAKLAKVENLSCHALRHRFGYLMVANRMR